MIHWDHGGHGGDLLFGLGRRCGGRAVTAADGHGRSSAVMSTKRGVAPV